MRKLLAVKWRAALWLAALVAPVICTDVRAACTYALSLSGKSHGNGATANSFSVWSGLGCTWGVTNTNSWIIIQSGSSGSATGTVNYSISANLDSITRTGLLFVVDQVFTITQSGIPCNYAISPVTRHHGKEGVGPGNPPSPIQVTAATNCQWTATTTNAWITFPGSYSGVSTGAVPYYVAANWTPIWRTGYVFIANRTLAIDQSPASCIFELSPTNTLRGYAGATGLVSVLPIPPDSGCEWFVNNTNPWITITATTTGTNTGSFGYSVAPNPNSSLRTGTVYVWDQAFIVLQNATPCSNAVIMPISASPDAEAQTNTVSVTPVGGCPDWAVVNTNTWVNVSPLSGPGNGVVTWSVALNSDTTGRTGVVRIAEQNFTIRQAGAACSYKLSASSRTNSYGATTNSVQLTVLSICPWSVENTNSWITMLTATNGTGSYSNAYALAPNSNANDRTGNLVIGGQVLSIRQLGVSCAINVSPATRGHGHGLATNSIVINIPAGCSWELLNTNSWLTIVATNPGPATYVTNIYVVAPNPTVTGRSGYITANEGAIFITQSGAPCEPHISPSAFTHTAAAETNDINVNAPIGCAWTVDNTNTWIQILTSLSGSGSNLVTYSITTNLNPAARVGTILVATNLYTVTQEGIVCSYRLSPTNRAHGFGATVNSLTMNATNPCPWEVVNTNTWITILINSNGLGFNTNISYAVAANSSTQERVGNIVAEGSTCVITQRGVTCTYSLSPSTRTHGYSATNASFSVTTPSACAWTVINTNPWVSILSATNGLGDGTVSYAITSNLDPDTRAGNIQIADQLFAISQSPASCNYKLSPTNRTHGFGATTNTVVITAGPACTWNMASTNAWITFLSPTNGMGNATNTYTISANFENNTRVGQITLVDEVLVLSQLAPTNGFVFESVVVSPAGDLTVRLGGGPAGIWELQSSSNLVNWVKVADLTNTTGRVEYHAPPPLSVMKYLRAVLP